MTSVTVKWGKEKLELDVDPNEPPLVFKSQLFAMTGVLPERQKILIKGKTLQDEAWNGITLSAGTTIMMMGSAGAIPTEPSKIQAERALEKNSDESSKKIIPMPRGLKNLGNTCYMNSVVQTLKSIPELRTALGNIAGETQEGDGSATRMARMLNRVNSALAEKKDDQPYMPFLLMQMLHQAFPQFDVRDARGNMEQQKRFHGVSCEKERLLWLCIHFENDAPEIFQDANECFTELQRLLLGGLAVAKDAKEDDKKMERYFRGSYKVTQKCLESEEEPESTSQETFYQLSCFLSQEVKYIQTGIKEKMTEEIVKRSEILGRDAKWQRKAVVSRLPAYISVQMVRFFYKEQAKTNAKILKDVKFPLILDLCDMCAPELQEKLRPMRDAVKKEEDAKIEIMRKIKLEGREMTDEEKEKADTGVPMPFTFEDDPGSNNSGFYELKAVITHKGRSSNSGHYVAWVRLHGDQWAMCDDDEVHPVHSDQILKLSGGGDWHSAYVLLYGPRIVKKYAPPIEAATEVPLENNVSEPMQTN